MPISAFLGIKASAAPVIAAFIAATVALYLNRRTAKNAERDRRRDLYGEAFQIALEWCEMVWRVRRRPADGSGDRQLVERFHQMQERIAYFEGWLTIESAEMGTAYRLLLNAALAECKPLIQDAWTEDGRHPSADAPVGEAAPNIAEAKAAFLLAARRHQSRWPLARLKLRRAMRHAAAGLAATNTTTTETAAHAAITAPQET